MDLKSRLAADDSLVGSWVSLPAPSAAELVAGFEFDFVVVDTEHAPIDVATLPDILRAVDAAPGETDVVVRVAWNDHVRIKRILDLGVDGLMAPQINDAAAAERLVEATRYPPEGRRGVAGGRAANYGRDLDSYFERAGDELAVIVQIESDEAAARAADIAAVDGVDGLFVGPADLSADLGCFGDYHAPDFEAAIDETLAAGAVTDTPVCTLATADAEIGTWLDRGFDHLVVGTDTGYLTSGARSAIRTHEEHR